MNLVAFSRVSYLVQRTFNNSRSGMKNLEMSDDNIVYSKNLVIPAELTEVLRAYTKEVWNKVNRSMNLDNSAFLDPRQGR